MNTITIQKQELNKINYSFVSDDEQKELEKEFGKTPIFDESAEIVRL